MSIQLNEIIKYFANASIQYSDLFITTLNPTIHDSNRNTAPHYSGIVYTLSGSADFSLNGEVYPLYKGELLHAGPMMKIDIQVTSKEPWQYVVIHYETLESYSTLGNCHFALETGEQNKLDYFVQQLIQFEKIPGDLNKLKCKSTFLQFVETMLVCAKMQTTSNVVDHAIAYMTENYTGPVAIANIAEEIGCERRRLAYLFDKQIGMSPIQFLTEVRLKQSKELLRTTTIPVKEIAELVGYQDNFYFCRVFKKRYFVTPTEYRKQFYND